MENIWLVFFVPIVLFMVIVAPIWLVLHYRHQGKTQSALSAHEQEDLETLALRAERMADRIEVLEAILDEQAPGWRPGAAGHQAGGSADDHGQLRQQEEQEIGNEPSIRTAR